MLLNNNCKIFQKLVLLFTSIIKYWVLFLNRKLTNYTNCFYFLLFSKKIWRWIPKSVHNKCTRNPRPARGLSCLVQLSTSHFRAALHYLCFTTAVYLLFYRGSSFFSHWLFWEDGGWRWCGNGLYPSKNFIKYTHLERRTHKHRDIWHSCLASVFSLLYVPSHFYYMQ